MFTILSDEVIENLTCYVCKGYLTVEPTKVYPNRTIKCGRCSQVDDSGTVSLLDKVLKSALVPCQNKFEGCTELLRYKEVRKHEEKCPKGNFSCPIPKCEEFQMSAFQMLNHFQSVHKNKILDKNVICIITDQHQRDLFLYRKENCLFIVKVDFDKGASDVRLGVSYIGPKELAKKIKYTFNIKIIKDNITFYTPKKHCTSLPETTDDSIDISPYCCDADPILLCTILIETYGVHPITYLNLNTKIKNTKEEKVLTHWDILDSSTAIQALHRRKLRLRPDFNPGDQFSLTISECKTAIIIQEGSSIKTNNFICSACKNNNLAEVPNIKVLGCPCDKYNVCVTCSEIFGFIRCKLGHPFTEQKTLTQIANSLEYSCKWNCEAYSFRIFDHEIFCRNNSMRNKGTCPLCPIVDFQDQIIDMSFHFQDKHHLRVLNDYFFQHFLNPKEEQFICNLWGHPIICKALLLENEIMELKFKPCDVDNFPHTLVAVLRIREDNEIKFKIYLAEKIYFRKSSFECLLLTII